VIAVGGENLIDLVQEKDALPRVSYAAIPGGSPFNCAIACARQGVPTAYLTPVSQDSLGLLLADRLTESHVTLAGGRRPEPTSLAVVSLDGGHTRYEFYREGTAERQIDPAQLAAALPAGARIFHVGSLALVGGDDAGHWESFFAQCHRDGLLTSLDPNVRPSLISDRDTYIARLERMFQHSDVLKLSDEDLEWLYPGRDFDAAVALIRKKTIAALIVITRAEKGAVAVSNAGQCSIPAAKVDPFVDAVGAGDTFMATLLRQLIDLAAVSHAGVQALSLDQVARCLTVASQAAALNCQEKGCNPPSLAALEQALA